MPDAAPTKYHFPQVFGSEVFELAKINQAMDAYFANAQSESATRYALVHASGWPASEAVTYTLCVVFLIDAGLDPNQPDNLEGLAEEVAGD